MTLAARYFPVGWCLPITKHYLQSCKDSSLHETGRSNIPGLLTQTHSVAAVILNGITSQRSHKATTDSSYSACCSESKLRFKFCATSTMSHPLTVANLQGIDHLTETVKLPPNVCVMKHLSLHKDIKLVC